MDKEKAFVIWFNDLGLDDVPLVGGKNAALGEMFRHLVPLGVKVPNGFAVTARAYNYFLDQAGLRQQIEDELKDLDTHNIKDLQKRGANVRKIILEAQMPEELEKVIIEHYGYLSDLYFADPDVAVRSSATAEDLPGASFAGQQETYLNVVGPEVLLSAVKKCMASLFTNRAISYRHDKGFPQTGISLSVAVQKMVRSDLATSGVMFTIDTETGFDKVVSIDASYGLGELVVQGAVTPDEYTVFKPTLKDGYRAIIGRNLGEKDVKMVYSGKGGKKIKVSAEDRVRFCLSDDEILQLADWGVKIEDYFSGKHGRYQPMDMEWAKDGESGELFIVQARPETVHSTADKTVYHEYRLSESGGKVLSEGAAVGTKIASGKARVIKDARHLSDFQKGEILITEITDPDWEPIMKIAAAIVTDRGGRTSHAAIVSRELGIPCVVGTAEATGTIKTGDPITVDCSSGKLGLVYKNELKYEALEHKLDQIPKTKTRVMVNIGSPEEAFKNHYLPSRGVGLGRLEFIINSYIRIHPRALMDFAETKKKRDLGSRRLIKKIDELTPGYEDKSAFYVDELAEGIAKIGATAWPEPALIRFSDFKTNEYRTLIGGELYEPEEENPMLGWRGASRYYHPDFKAAFGLECAALKRARETFGLKNIAALIPFVRTVEEFQQVLDTMKEFGLDQTTDQDFKVYIMCEVPSNITLADQFLDLCDGMSIGSNDLTQLTLGLDRDSQLVSGVGNENNEAVKRIIGQIIDKCNSRNKYIGICGQGPSDFPGFAKFLVERGIKSLSLSPDTVVKTLGQIAEVEKDVHN
ncbi:MAG: phosphoenolpyruvate synthase [Patescibacteria group bacterium]|nr:phosphoenolpyruvate synthase [Patescibacteria group bacterium]